MITLEIDGRQVSVPPGTLVLDAAKKLGVKIPYFCHHKHLFPLGACRMCLVEIEKMPKLQTSCTMPVAEGMVVHTDTPQVKAARQSMLEFLLLRHPLDCPVCDAGGECKLQDYVFAHGAGVSRLRGAKPHSRKAVNLGTIVLDEERCVLCQRCVRFFREVVGDEALTLQQRGNHSVVGTFGDRPIPAPFSGNLAEICPVGALTAKSYRFRARPWDLLKTYTTCGHCSVGCSLRVDTRRNVPVRAVSGKDSKVDRGWTCDRGRFGYGFTGSSRRLTQPLVRVGGVLQVATWEEAIGATVEGLKGLGLLGEAGGGAKVAGLGGARLTDQEALLFNRFARTVLGTNHVDWRVGLQRRAIPWDNEASFSDLSDAVSILLLETSLRETAPVLSLWIPAAAREGGRVHSVGPLPAGEPNEVHHFYPPGGGGTYLDSFEPPDGKTVVVWNGQDESLEAPLARLQARASAAGKQVLLLIAGDAANARGAEGCGLLPDRLPGLLPFADQAARAELEGSWGKLPDFPGLDTPGILAAAAAGEIKGLYLVGANPLLTYPDGKLARAALERSSFTVVHDLFLSETAQLAHVVFPAASWLEKGGTYTNLAGQTRTLRPATSVGVRSDGDILASVAACLGRPLPWDLAEVGDAGPVTLSGRIPPRSGVGAGATPGGTGATDGSMRVLTSERLFAGGGTATACQVYEYLAAPFRAEINPEDAAALGLTDGAVMVEGDGFTLRTEIAADERVPRGYLLLPRRVPDLPANRLEEGSLVRIGKAAAGSGAPHSGTGREGGIKA